MDSSPIPPPRRDLNIQDHVEFPIYFRFYGVQSNYVNVPFIVESHGMYN
jgi:hypothetical protein